MRISMIYFVNVGNFIQKVLLAYKTELAEGKGYEDIIQRIMESTY